MHAAPPQENSPTAYGSCAFQNTIVPMGSLAKSIQRFETSAVIPPEILQLPHPSTSEAL